MSVSVLCVNHLNGSELGNAAIFTDFQTFSHQGVNSNHLSHFFIQSSAIFRALIAGSRKILAGNTSIDLRVPPGSISFVAKSQASLIALLSVHHAIVWLAVLAVCSLTAWAVC